MDILGCDGRQEFWGRRRLQPELVDEVRELGASAEAGWSAAKTAWTSRCGRVA